MGTDHIASMTAPDGFDYLRESREGNKERANSRPSPDEMSDWLDLPLHEFQNTLAANRNSLDDACKRRLPNGRDLAHNPRIHSLVV